MAASANLGYILGPALAGILGATAFGEILPVSAAFVISLIATAMIMFMLPESNIHPIKINPELTNVRKVLGQDHKECFEIECEEKLSFIQVLKLGNVLYVLSLYFLVFLGFNFFYIAFPVFAVKSLYWSLTETGLFFSFIGLTMAFVQGPVLSRITKILSDTQLIVYGSLILALSFLFFLSELNAVIYMGAALLSLGNGLMWSSILAILSKSSDEKYQGAVQGIAGSVGSLASILGLLVGGLLYEQLSSNIFILAAIILFLVFLMALKFPVINKNEGNSMQCIHGDRMKSVKPSSEGCINCLNLGESWVHLRICLECGHVGCCESSKNKHASDHYKKTGHTLMQSFEKNEYWGWCFEEELPLKFEKKMY